MVFRTYEISIEIHTSDEKEANEVSDKKARRFAERVANYLPEVKTDVNLDVGVVALYSNLAGWDMSGGTLPTD